MRLRSSEMAGQMPLVRRVEHLRRGDRGQRERLGAGDRRGRGTEGRAAARARHPRDRPAAPRPRQQRGQPRAGRRHGAGLARAAGRRAGHRQVDPLAADRTGRQLAAHALRLGRGVGRADQDACGAAGHRQRGVPRLPRKRCWRTSWPRSRSRSPIWWSSTRSKPSTRNSSTRRRAACRRSANAPRRCSNTPRRRARRSSSSATSRRTAPSPARRSSNTSSTWCSSSRATATTSTASCGASRTASAPPSRSGSSRCSRRDCAASTTPPEILLTHYEEPLSGIAVGASADGVRPYLIEVQALVSGAAYGTPQRTATGFDARRMSMLLAVLEKRVGMKMFQKDVFLNFAGGFKVADPGLDLAVVAAVISSYYDRPVAEGSAVRAKSASRARCARPPHRAAHQRSGTVGIQTHRGLGLPAQRHQAPRRIEIVTINSVDQLPAPSLSNNPRCRPAEPCKDPTEPSYALRCVPRPKVHVYPLLPPQSHRTPHRRNSAATPACGRTSVAATWPPRVRTRAAQSRFSPSCSPQHTIRAMAQRPPDSPNPPHDVDLPHREAGGRRRRLRLGNISGIDFAQVGRNERAHERPLIRYSGGTH